MTSFFIWWRTVAWVWLKKYWYLILLGPLALLVLLKRRPMKVEVTSTQLSQADAVKAQATVEKNARLELAAGDMAAKVDEAAKDHDEVVGGLVLQQEDRAASPPAEDDLSEFMKKVGKDVR